MLHGHRGKPGPVSVFTKVPTGVKGLPPYLSSFAVAKPASVAYKRAMERARSSLIPMPEWLSRCRARILELDSRLAEQDILELAHILAERPSCRALEPERVADLLFQNRLSPSAWGRLEDEV